MSVVRPQFGRLVALDTSEQFLDAVDQEHKDVTVIVHLYDEVRVISLPEQRYVTGIVHLYDEVRVIQLTRTEICHRHCAPVR